MEKNECRLAFEEWYEKANIIRLTEHGGLGMRHAAWLGFQEAWKQASTQKADAEQEDDSPLDDVSTSSMDMLKGIFGL